MVLKAVLFDLWGTLIHDPERLSRPRQEWRARNVYDALCRHGCSNYDVAAIDGALRTAGLALGDLHDAGVDPTSAGRVQLLLRYLAAEGAPDLPPSVLAEIESAITDMHDDFLPGLAQDAVDTLTSLKRLGLGTALISNAGFTTAPTLRRMLEGWGLLPHLDVLVFSDEMELAKPDPRMFAAALDALAVDAAAAAYVGDSPHNDVAGARASGLFAVQIGDRAMDGIKPDLHIETLNDLVPALQSRGLLSET